MARKTKSKPTKTKEGKAKQRRQKSQIKQKKGRDIIARSAGARLHASSQY